MSYLILYLAAWMGQELKSLYMDNLNLRSDFMTKKNKNSEEYRLYKEKVLKHENPVIEDLKDDMSQPTKGLPKARG
jgi:hypothetical protein